VAIKSPCLVSGTDMAWVVTSKEPNTLQSMQVVFTKKGENHTENQFESKSQTVQLCP